MEEIKKLRLVKSKDDKKDIVEIEVNSNNIDIIIDILENGFEKDGETFYTNYDDDNNLDTLCEIIFDFGYKKLEITDNSTRIDDFNFEKIMNYFDKSMVDIKLYNSDHNNNKKLIEKFTNKLVEKANEKYGFLKEYDFEDKNFQINLEEKNFDEFYIEFTDFLRDLLINSNNFILKNKINTQNKDPEEMTINYFKNFIEEKINKKEDVDKFIKLFKQSNLKGNKDILKFAFEKRGSGFLKPLLNDKDINWELNKNDIEDLFICACNNTCSNPEQVIKYFFDKFSDKIDINEPYRRMNYQKGKTLLDNIIEKSNSLEEDDLIEILIKKLDLKNLKLIDIKNKFKLLYPSITYSNDINLFKDYYNNSIIILEIAYKNNYNELSKNIKNININCIRQFYTKGYTNIVDILNFIQMDEKNLSDFLNNDLIKANTINVKLFNNILTGIENKFQYPEIINSGLKVEGQGADQITINKRTITYNENENPKTIKKIKDTIYTNLKDENKNKKLYEVIYKDDGTKEITYYKKDGAVLDKILIDEDNEINFTVSEDELDKEEIAEILNDNYKSRNGFDYKLSFLSYLMLKNEENISFKTNCINIEDITNVIKNNENKEELVICDLNIDEHNVQIVINNENITLLNTGYDFEYIKNKIKTSYREQFSKDIKIKQVRTINQNCNNCNIASKLYTVVLSEKYKQNFENLKNLSERLNKFEEFMEDTLNKTKEEQKDNFNNFKETENIKMLKVILETNVELFNKHEKHFNKMDEKLKNFYKVIKKIDKASNNEEDKILDSKMEEMYKMTNVIGLGHEINKICEEKKINNEYKDIIEYIINNTKEIQRDNKINKIKALKKNKILLKIIKNSMNKENVRIKNKKINRINEILENKQGKGIEQIFQKCIEEIGDLTAKELGL